MTQQQIDEMVEAWETLQIAIEEVVDAMIEIFERVKRAICEFIEDMQRWGLTVILMYQIPWLPMRLVVFIAQKCPTRFLPSIGSVMCWGNRFRIA